MINTFQYRVPQLRKWMPLLLFVPIGASAAEGRAMFAPEAAAAVTAAAPSADALQQVRKVTGRVVDQTGEPMVGATVLVRGTKVMTLTDAEGRYSINVPAGRDELQFNYIGSKMQV